MQLKKTCYHCSSRLKSELASITPFVSFHTYRVFPVGGSVSLFSAHRMSNDDPRIHLPPSSATSEKLKGSEHPAGACPVDHSTRAAWVSAAGTAPSSKSSSQGSCDSVQIDRLSSTTALSQKADGGGASGIAQLSGQRAISSIPRGESISNGNIESPLGPSAGVDVSPRNWIYPSEQMFFNAMKRKNWDPKAEDMRMIVPIHNAVNEKAWGEILAWERGRGSEKCGGPKLLSFSGDSQKITPKARLLVLLGYQAPFDRHDWVVDRCGKRIEYVIDFYSGKKGIEKPESISFYLDVRPKLSFEGLKMRIQRWFSW